MSDIQQAVRDKYGAIATAVTNASGKTGLLRPDGVRLRRSHHLRPVLRLGDSGPAP